MKKIISLLAFSVVIVCSGCATSPVAYQVDYQKATDTEQQARKFDAIGDVVWVNPPLKKQQK